MKEKASTSISISKNKNKIADFDNARNEEGEIANVDDDGKEVGVSTAGPFFHYDNIHVKDLVVDQSYNFLWGPNDLLVTGKFVCKNTTHNDGSNESPSFIFDCSRTC